MFIDRVNSAEGSSSARGNQTEFDPLIARLEMFVTLGAEDRQAVASLSANRRMGRAGETLVHEGSRVDRVCLIVRGVAYRYRYLPSGHRQILGYLLPGDLCDTQFVIIGKCDHNVGLLCDTEIAMISPLALMSAMVQFPRIERGLLMMALVETAILREWLLNVGQRDAYQKMAHFFCEIAARFSTSDLIEGRQSYDIPLTQNDLADTMGLSVVHVNRVLQKFRREGILNWSRRHFDVIDNARLELLAGFDPAYLRIATSFAEPKMAAYG